MILGLADAHPILADASRSSAGIGVSGARIAPILFDRQSIRVTREDWTIDLPTVLAAS